MRLWKRKKAPKENVQEVKRIVKKVEHVSIKQKSIWKDKNHSLNFIGIESSGITGIVESYKELSSLPIKQNYFKINSIHSKAEDETIKWKEAYDFSNDNITGVGTSISLGQGVLKLHQNELDSLFGHFTENSNQLVVIFADCSGLTVSLLPYLVKKFNDMGIFPICFLTLPSASFSSPSVLQNAGVLLHDLILTNELQVTVFPIDIGRIISIDEENFRDHLRNPFKSISHDFYEILQASLLPTNDSRFTAGYSDLLSFLQSQSGFAVLLAAKSDPSDGIAESERQLIPLFLNEYKERSVYKTDPRNAPQIFLYTDAYLTIQFEIEIRRISSIFRGATSKVKVTFIPDDEDRDVKVYGICRDFEPQDFIGGYISQIFHKVRDYNKFTENVERTTSEVAEIFADV